jgi:hypothetical protein
MALVPAHIETEGVRQFPGSERGSCVQGGVHSDRVNEGRVVGLSRLR